MNAVFCSNRPQACRGETASVIYTLELMVNMYISHKTTRVVKTCPPCMFDELEDRKSYENHVINVGKIAL